jgi:hypothetical protein
VRTASREAVFLVIIACKELTLFTRVLCTWPEAAAVEMVLSVGMWAFSTYLSMAEEECLARA